MPILWRYLIRSFLNISLTCVIAFIAILLAMRLDDIAHFAALGAPFRTILFFTLYQIPYILPIALPLSCLIAGLILTQKLSSSHELTALRASGFSLKDIIAPIVITAAFLSLANFWITSELATHSHLQTNLLKTELRSINPLLLLNNKHIMNLKGFFFEALGTSRVGESASDIILVVPNHHQKRLNLITAKNLKFSSALFTAEQLTTLTASPNKPDSSFDQLLIENIGKSETQIQNLSDLLQKKIWSINNDYLTLRLLLARIKEQRKLLSTARLIKSTPYELIQLSHQLNRSLSEVIKRLSIAIAIFTFTLMGMALGMNISRQRSDRYLYLCIGLTVLYLSAFFMGKSLEHHRWLSALLFIIPHVIIIFVSLHFLRRIAKGFE